MKRTSILAALAGFVVLTGCDTPTPTLLSLEQVATSQDNTIDDRLIGTWQEPGDKDAVCIIRRDDTAGYQIKYLAGNSTTGFQARLFRVGDVELLDVAPTDDNDFRIPGHAVARVWPASGSLRFAFLDSDWLKQQTRQLATHESDGKMLLLSPGDAVRAFIAANGANDKAYGKPATWEKAQ